MRQPFLWSVGVCAAVVAVAAAASATCNSAVDCMLNGVCEDGACVCDAPWVGSQCTDMAFKANAVDYGQNGYGQSTTTNMSTWGGNTVFDGKTYHLYVAEMVNGCPLSDWGKNSRVSHATSTDPAGPFQFADVAVNVWAHNPEVVQYREPGGATEYALFHIGSGSGGRPTTCSSTDDAFVDEPAAGSTLHVAKSPDGPWIPSDTPPPNCNNPAPLQHPNGTWFLICDSVTMLRAPALAGPWTKVATTNRTGWPSEGIHYEDAFLYLDARNNFHVLYHVYNITTPCVACDSPIVSGHDFSEDGLTWYSAPGQPFGNQYTTTDGHTVTVSTRERPKLMFDASGTPTHLINGVSHVATCPPIPSVNCKTHGPMGYWTYTLVAPLVTA